MSASRRWIIALCTVAFLLARLTGAHLHLCLDGSEPLAQLHVADSAAMDHHHSAVSETVHSIEHADAGPHDDVDVDVDGISSALAKVAKLDLPVLALLTWCLALFYVAFVRQPLPALVRHPERPPPRYLRPLLRAPPF